MADAHDVTRSRESTSVTDLLLAWGQGDQAALNQLMPLLRTELQQLARRHMRGERQGHTLQTTALVNEAYLRLLDLNRVQWQDRTHFLSMSARLMRRILVDYARSRNVAKRSGGVRTVPFDEARMSLEPGTDLIALDEALQTLAAIDARKSQVVEMRFFGGLSVAETADALGMSAETVMRDWRVAKAWLLNELRRHG